MYVVQFSNLLLQIDFQPPYYSLADSLPDGWIGVANFEIFLLIFLAMESQRKFDV